MSLPARAPANHEALKRMMPTPAVDIPHIAPLPSTPRTIFGRPKYKKQTELVTAAAQTVKAAETFVRNATSLEQAAQEHALTVAKREAMPILHLANMNQAETIALGTITTRIHAERAMLDAIAARDADRRDDARVQELTVLDHQIAVHEKRRRLAEAKHSALRAEAMVHSHLYGSLLREVAAFNRRSFNDPADGDASEFDEAYAEEERRAGIIRAADRRKEEVRRGNGSERSKREQIERIDQATQRALKKYDLGQAGIVMPDDEEE